MIDCKTYMPPEGREVLVKIGYRFAVAYWLNVDDKPVWLPSSAMKYDFDQGSILVGEPSAWAYLPTKMPSASTVPPIFIDYACIR